MGYLNRCLLLFKIRRYDVVYNFLWVTPFGKPVFEFFVSSLAKKLIYDIDDMVFLGHSSAANKKLQVIKGKTKMIHMMKKADHVITCTPVLDKFVRQYNSNTTDISSTINTEEYIVKACSGISEPITIGWSGSHSTSQYVHLMEPVLLELLKRGLKFKMLVIGDPDFKFANNSIPLETIPWTRDTEVADLKRIDIGVYPLPDDHWVYGKSGLTALQYMALGIPTIATDIGTIRRVISDGENGFLVKSTEGWADAVERIAHSQDIQEKFYLKGRQTVLERFSLKANAPLYLDILTA